MSHHLEDGAAYLRPLTDEAMAAALALSLHSTKPGRLAALLSAGEPHGCPNKTLLTHALEVAVRDHWEGTRTGSLSEAQALIAVGDLQARGVYHVEDVTVDTMRILVKQWMANGMKASSVRRRLANLGVMRLPVQGARPKVKKTLKWWLNPTDRDRLLKWLRGSGEPPIKTGSHLDHNRLILADYIEWTSYTGLRVEESLRLRWRDIEFKVDPKTGCYSTLGMSMLPPGTKTNSSHAALPLGSEAADLIVRRRAAAKDAPADGFVFPVTYLNLRLAWRPCREFLGAMDNSTSTLKAIRRSAARYLHTDRGMPLDVTRRYLRHSNVQTTMGYLALVGGYDTEEMRKWLK